METKCKGTLMGKKKMKQILKYSIQLTVTYNCILAFTDIPRYCTKLIMKELNKGYTGTLCTTFVSLIQQGKLDYSKHVFGTNG